MNNTIATLERELAIRDARIAELAKPTPEELAQSIRTSHKRGKRAGKRHSLRRRTFAVTTAAGNTYRVHTRTTYPQGWAKRLSEETLCSVTSTETRHAS